VNGNKVSHQYMNSSETSHTNYDSLSPSQTQLSDCSNPVTMVYSQLVCAHLSVSSMSADNTSTFFFFCTHRFERPHSRDWDYPGGEHGQRKYFHCISILKWILVTSGYWSCREYILCILCVCMCIHAPASSSILRQRIKLKTLMASFIPCSYPNPNLTLALTITQPLP